MRKLGSVLLGTLALNMVAVVPALADSVVPPPEEPPEGVVVVPPGADGVGGLAFAGGDVTVWMVLAMALLVLGVGLFLLGRRRRATAE